MVTGVQTCALPIFFSGKIDNIGAFIRENSGKSFRRGVEFGFNLKPIKNIQILANATWSENKNLRTLLCIHDYLD